MNALSPVSSLPALTSYSSARDSYGALGDWPASIGLLVARTLHLLDFKDGIERTNNRGGYFARNYEVYGYDAERQIVAIQLRLTSLRRAGDWTKQQKIYLIAGIDEGQLFSHALSTSFQRMKDVRVAAPEAVVRWAESKIFRVPLARLDTIIRQGDVALVPVRSIPSAALAVDGARTFTLRDSHKVAVDGTIYHDAEAARWFVDGVVQIDHEPGQHRSIDADGRFEVVCGDRRDIAFSTPD